MKGKDVEAWYGTHRYHPRTPQVHTDVPVLDVGTWDALMGRVPCLLPVYIRL